jgi:predicted helicase
MDIQGYLNNIRHLAQSGRATEHSYRPALAGLFKSIDENLTVINEPKQSAVGAPDFVFERNGVSIGWCEAKDLRKDISRFGAGDYSREQKERYKKGLPNLIYTNGTDFEFIREGEVTGFVSIADLAPALPPRHDEFPRLEMLLKDFSAQTPISINSAKQLAKMMAGKAVIIKDIMGNALMADKNNNIETELTDQYEGFKKSLIHDITIADFADVYAETIAYGLFAARLHDHSLGTFNRAEALELLPKSNPFLRDLFVYIAGNNLDDRLRRMIDDLCDVFRACDVGALMQDFGKFTARNDPFLHFYETFLAEYNPAKRKARGVWYTPEPVVNFIVRAVDDVLKTEFNLPRGIADTSKIQIDWDTGQNDGKTGKPLTIKKDVHRVQILDPATGTGTFLAEAIKQIAAQVKDIAPGMWSGYVEENLIPRLHGFELLMASYAMCHLKLDMMLTEMGYKPSSTPPRLSVYLTNSLEEGQRVEQKFEWARFISKEAKGANTIKRDTPIMCIIGNPPYSVSSSNNSPFIEGLVRNYKEGLNERNIQPLSDDYIKFLRFSQHLIDKNSYGVLGFITNNSYLDGLIHRVMRKSLLDSFSSIYIVDLHGSTKRKEVAPDGSSDVNVFDIQQGVSIIIAVKNADKQGDAPVVRHLDLWGSRASKNEALFSLEFNSAFEPLKATEPSWYFVPKDFQSQELYEQCFSIRDLMPLMSSGVKTHKDDFVVAIDRAVLEERIGDVRELSEETLREKYRLGNDVRDWKVSFARQDVQANFNSEKICQYNYRPFDARWTFLSGKTKGFLSYPRAEVMFHLQAKDNFALNVCRQLSGSFFAHGLVSNIPIDLNSLSLQTKEQSYCAPLYLYPEEGTLETERRVNFDPKIYAEIKAKAGLSGADGDELKVFDYIYGVLHSPDYRATYAQFLKIDFPRIPYPPSPEVFAHVAEKGGALRRLHLMEDTAIGDTPFPFVGDGDTVVGKPVLTDDGRVMINPDQYFDNVPQVAWEFHIGGYQPAQKWLKDRKGRALSFDDVVHYQKIIKILSETDRIMREIILPL